MLGLAHRGRSRNIEGLRIGTYRQRYSVYPEYCQSLGVIKRSGVTERRFLPSDSKSIAEAVAKGAEGVAGVQSDGSSLGTARRADDLRYLLSFVSCLKDERGQAIYYLSADLQDPEIFEKRKPLGPDARRASWQGFIYRLDRLRGGLVRLL